MPDELTALSFTVSGRVARPVAQVYEAVADPDQLSRYFTTGGARGRLEPGAEPLPLHVSQLSCRGIWIEVSVPLADSSNEISRS